MITFDNNDNNNDHTLYQPKRLRCTLTLPFSGWKCNVILLRPW